MAKQGSDPKAATLARIRRTEAYAEKVRLLFAKTVNDILALNKTMPSLDEGVMFSFDGESVKKQKEVEVLLRRLHSAVTMAIQQGVKLEWHAANQECDKLVQSVFGKKVLESPEFSAWMGRNTAARDAFLSRSEHGLNLSDRVWKSVRQLRDEMEVAMTVSIGEGESSSSMSRKVRQYLNNPDDMFRRFRYKKGEKDIIDPETGEIKGKEIVYGKKWKKRIKDEVTGKYKWIDYDRDSYKTGAGVYKSSARNAMRVARTETNIAYRRADNARWQDMDFVLGQRVQLSKNHPKKDICDKLQGDYPKDFVFDGWHPQCFCFCTPILMDESEMAKVTEAFLKGEKYTPRGKQITDYPAAFKDWVRDHAEDIAASRERGTEPYFIRNNAQAIDEIIKTRQDQFSRIQARFKTRLSLTSSSADEVIQKRILRKKEEVTPQLEQVYNENDSVLRNLFSFTDAILDIKGYSGPGEFARNFPFVPYQFIIMQKVFSEIRKHGNSGKHLSGGERSMLSGFQEAAQKIEDKDEYALAPFYLFYDTVHTFLDSSIRRVIERCQKAADTNAGIEQQDVSVLKLLYLVRYIDDIKANLDNIVILMADDIRMDKIIMREQVRGSLDRLMSQNYIGRTGDTYNFLTDEEQDIQREIRNTPVDTAAIVERIAHMVFGDIYTAKKFRYGKYDFAFDQMVDNTTVGAVTGGMRLKIMTVATDSAEKAELRVMTESSGQSIVVLADTPYYESLENAMKIRKYVKQRNVAQLPKTVRDIIANYQNEADKYEQSAQGELADAITMAQFYVDGEKIEVKATAVSSKEEDPVKRDYEIKKGKARSVIDQSLDYLVSHVYSDLDLIRENSESDADIIALLTGANSMIPGTEPNRDAAAKIEEYLEMQDRKHLPTSMADIQSRYQAIPYGWREIDIAAVVALLIVNQKVTIKYAYWMILIRVS